MKLAFWKETKANNCFLSLQSSEAHPTVMLFALIALEKFSQTSKFTLCNSSSHLPGVNKLRTSAFYTVTVSVNCQITINLEILHSSVFSFQMNRLFFLYPDKCENVIRFSHNVFGWPLSSVVLHTCLFLRHASAEVCHSDTKVRVFTSAPCASSCPQVKINWQCPSRASAIAWVSWSRGRNIPTTSRGRLDSAHSGALTICVSWAVRSFAAAPLCMRCHAAETAAVSPFGQRVTV